MALHSILLQLGIITMYCKIYLIRVLSVKLYSGGLFFHLKIVENRAKKVHAKKRAFGAKNGALTDFSYNSLISDKILDIY